MQYRDSQGGAQYPRSLGELRPPAYLGPPPRQTTLARPALTKRSRLRWIALTSLLLCIPPHANHTPPTLPQKVNSTASASAGEDLVADSEGARSIIRSSFFSMRRAHPRQQGTFGLDQRARRRGRRTGALYSDLVSPATARYSQRGPLSRRVSSRIERRLYVRERRFVLHQDREDIAAQAGSVTQPLSAPMSRSRMFALQLRGENRLHAHGSRPRRSPSSSNSTPSAPPDALGYGATW